VSGLYTCLPPRYFGGTADSGASGWTGRHAEDDGERSAIAAQDGKRSKNAARACVAAWKEHRVEHSDWGRGFAGRGPTPEVGTVGLPELTGVVAVEERREESSANHQARDVHLRCTFSLSFEDPKSVPCGAGSSSGGTA
jgi:hypothetical protein